MPLKPPCTRMGKHCREIKLTIRISDLEDDSPTLIDAASTWLTGHTQRISFGDPYVSGDYFMVDAIVHVPCRYFAVERKGAGRHPARCRAHGFKGNLPRTTPKRELKLQLGADRFSIIHRRRRRNLNLPLEAESSRSLPVIEEENPCRGAPCRTADNTVGAACCRDLSLEIDLPESQTFKEALLRSRKSPYLCKVKREDDETMEAEVISACGYLSSDDNLSCTLHGRTRPNGRPAKPSICTEWPEELDDDETGHPGCRLV